MALKITKKQPNSRMCFVCGLENKFGLQSSFYELENKEVLGIFEPKNEQQSYPNRVHGGISASMLDETLARAIMPYYEEVIWGVTLEFNIKYRKPLPIKEKLYSLGRITTNLSSTFEANGEIRLSDGTLAIEGKGKYIKLPLDKIFDVHNQDLMWKVVLDKNDPKYFKLI